MQCKQTDGLLAFNYFLDISEFHNLFLKYSRGAASSEVFLGHVNIKSQGNWLTWAWNHYRCQRHRGRGTWKEEGRGGREVRDE